MGNFLSTLLYFVIIFAIMFGVMILGRKFVFSKVRINKFIPLGISIALLIMLVVLVVRKLSHKKIEYEEPNGRKPKKEKKKSNKWMLLGIRNKIAVCFIIPIIFMIIIGISAYQKSSDGMGEKYKEATIQTLQKSVEYIEMISSAVETEAVKYTADTELINYMAGL